MKQTRLLITLATMFIFVVNVYAYENTYYAHKVSQFKLLSNKKNVTIGYFSSFDDAVNARKNAEIANGFHENHGKDL